jgi:hypothetical protein
MIEPATMLARSAVARQVDALSGLLCTLTQFRLTGARAGNEASSRLPEHGRMPNIPMKRTGELFRRVVKRICDDIAI